MYLFIQQTQFWLEVVLKIVIQGDMTRFNLTFNSCWFVTQDHVFPFLDIPFNKSLGVEYELGTLFVVEVLSDFIWMEESLGAHFILFLRWNMGVTSLR